MDKSNVSVMRWLWTHNPFYFISALLMLYAVRSAYGELNIGTINCWMMMSVLAGYTLVLAIIGVLIVRYGRVWDDARSILLLLLLLFLAVSVSADDLFVKMESRTGGAALLACGFFFSITVMLSTLRGAGIRLGTAYLVPFILFLGLFYVMPWWCSPELNPRFEPKQVDWTVFLFPQFAAGLCLTLIPAARLGKAYIANNGTPWSWPFFPWTAFGMIATAVVLRSYALALTFSPTGVIWVSPDSRFGIVLDTIWRPYFLVPFAFSILVLILESAIVARNHRLMQRTLLAVPALFLLAWPWFPSAVMMTFLSRFTSGVASPVWITAWLILFFYIWATLRRVPGAELGMIAAVLPFTVIDHTTINLATLAAIKPWPIIIMATTLGAIGLVRRSSAITMASVAILAFGLWILTPATVANPYRMSICFHVILTGLIAIGLWYRDPFSEIVRIAGAVILPISALMSLTVPAAAEIPIAWRLTYIAILSAIALCCWQLSRSRLFLTSFYSTGFLLGYGLSLGGFRAASDAFGRRAVTAFSWSCGTLLIGILISAYKAGWMPAVVWQKWLAMGEDTLPVAPESNSPQKPVEHITEVTDPSSTPQDETS